MIGDITIPIETRKDWVWKEMERTHPEFNRENFPVDDPYALHEIVVQNCYRYKPKRWDSVMDIGANIGIFTALCALNGCDVAAYEPNPAAFKVLSETILRNDLGGRVCPYNIAVWTHTGECSYHPTVTPPTGDLQTWTSYNGAINTPGADPEVKIACITLAAALGVIQWHCVKVDIEGAEFDLLTSADDETLWHIKFLTVELHNGHADKQRHDALVDRLKRVFTLDGVKDGDPRFAGEDRYISLFCYRR